MIGDAGFRLSVMATAGLLAWANPLAARLRRVAGGRLPGWLAESLGISLAAQAATLPDVLATFGRLSLVSPVVNLAVVPLVPAAMLGGVVAMLAGGAGMLGAPSAVATLAGLPGWVVLHVIVTIVRIARVPAVRGADAATRRRRAGGARHRRRDPARAQRVDPSVARSWSVVPAGHAAERDRRRPEAGAVAGRPRRIGRPERVAVAVAALAVAVAVAALSDAAGRATRITVMDVGQGDAILLETRTGARMLIDGGPDPDRILLALDERIPPWDRRLDVVVLTHPHEDHVAGLARVLARYSVGRVYEPGMRGPGPGWTQWNAELRDGPPRAGLQTGAQLRLGEVRLSVLWPDPGAVPLEPPDTGTGINNVSIVFLGEADGRRFLLMGDVEQGIDPTLLARGLPHVDLLKVAHHGSATASTQPFVDAVRPKVAIASAGAGNPYGHPAKSTLDRLRASGATRVPDGPGRLGRGGAPRGRPLGPRDRRPRGGSDHGRRGRHRVPVRHPGPARAHRRGSRLRRRRRRLRSPERWNLAETTGRASAWADPTGYDPLHDDPRSPRSRPPAGVPASVGQVHPARLRRRRHRGLPRVSGEPGGTGRQPSPGRDGRAAPRRRQAGHGAGARPPPARRGVGGLARGAWLPGARARGPGPPGDPARGSRLRGVGEDRDARGADRRLRGQAGGPAPRADGRALRALEAEVPARVGRARAPERQRRLERGGVRAGGAPCAGPGARGLRSRGRRSRRRRPTAVVEAGPSRDRRHERRRPGDRLLPRRRRLHDGRRGRGADQAPRAGVGRPAGPLARRGHRDQRRRHRRARRDGPAVRGRHGRGRRGSGAAPPVEGRARGARRGDPHRRPRQRPRVPRAG